MVRKRGRFYYFDFQVKRKRVRTTTGETDRERAEKRERKARAALKAQLRGEGPLCTVAEMVALWLKVYGPNYSKSYVKAVETFGRLHLYNLAEVRVDELTSFQIEEARARHRFSEPRHDAPSANHWLRILKMLYHHAVTDWKMIEFIPWRVTMLKEQEPVRPVLPKSKTVAWLAAVDAQGLPAASRAVRLMLGLGLREMESYGARWEWLNLEDATYQPGQTKNRHAELLRVRPSLMAYLKPLAQRKGLICPMPSGRMAWPGYCRRVMEKANEACDLVGITPHRLRGTLATQLMQKLPLKESSAAMRHKRYATTVLYQTRDMTLLNKAFEELDREMGLAE